MKILKDKKYIYIFINKYLSNTYTIINKVHCGEDKVMWALTKSIPLGGLTIYKRKGKKNLTSK